MTFSWTAYQEQSTVFPCQQPCDHSRDNEAANHQCYLEPSPRLRRLLGTGRRHLLDGKRLVSEKLKTNLELLELVMTEALKQPNGTFLAPGKSDQDWPFRSHSPPFHNVKWLMWALNDYFAFESPNRNTILAIPRQSLIHLSTPSNRA